MIEAIDHVVLTSRNLKKTINFYKNILDMVLMKRIIEVDNSTRYSLHFGNQKINIHVYNNVFTPHAKISKPGTLDICFISKKKICYWQKKFKKNNIKIIEGPIERFGACFKLISIYCNDPDGNLIEISNKVQNND